MCVIASMIYVSAKSVRKDQILFTNSLETSNIASAAFNTDNSFWTCSQSARKYFLHLGCMSKTMANLL